MISISIGNLEIFNSSSVSGIKIIFSSIANSDGFQTVTGISEFLMIPK